MCEPEWPPLAGSLRKPGPAAHLSMGIGQARKELRKQGKNSQAERAIFTNILEPRRIVEMAVSTAKRRRQQEKTPADSRTPREFNPQPASAKEASVEMKPYPVEIWEGP